jgi:GTPase
LNTSASESADNRNFTEVNEDLGNTISTFEQIQEELNYQQARDVLRDIVETLDLQPQEKAGLETEISDLTGMLDKLERSIIHIAVFGMVGRGKSSVLNALVGQQVFTTGPLHGVTRDARAITWQIPEVEADLQRITLTGSGNSQVELIDTPGIDEIEGEEREILARQVATQVDLILFVIAGDMTKVEFEALSRLREAGKPIVLIFNKIDQYPDRDRLAIYEKIRDERVQQLVSPNEIVMIAASPLVAEAVRRPDGSLGVIKRVGTPQVDELKLKILEILHREGKSLVALNTMLYAGEINERVVQKKMAIREENANQIVWKAVTAKALVVALNPITVIDLVTGAAVDLSAILTLSRLYDIRMTQAGALRLLQQIALSMGGISASELLANLGLSSLKSLLGISAPLTGGTSLAGYASVAIAQASVAGVSTYAIAQVTKTYLANGASWGPDGPKAVVNKILSTLDEKSIISRIEQELRAKLYIKSRLG